MEDKKLNEKESLELIAQMIQNTRRNLDQGSGNLFLLWGYVGALVTLVVFAGVSLTKNPAWMWGFWGLPVLGYPLAYLLKRKQKKPVKSYIDSVLEGAWQIVGLLCMAIVLGATYFHAFEIILPICAILLSLGSFFTCFIIRYTVYSGLVSVGTCVGLGMLFDAWIGRMVSYETLPCFALVLVCSMIIPGHILNYKAKKETTKGQGEMG